MSFGGAILWYMRINSFNWKKVHWIYVWSKVRTDQRGNRSAKKGQVHQVLSTLSCWLGLLSASFRKRWCGFRGRCAASAIRWWPPTRAPTWCVSAASAWPSLSPLSSITSTTCCSPTTRYSSWGSPILCTDGASTCNGFIRRGLDYFLKKKTQSDLIFHSFGSCGVPVLPKNWRPTEWTRSCTSRCTRPSWTGCSKWPPTTTWASGNWTKSTSTVAESIIRKSASMVVFSGRQALSIKGW